MTDPSLRPARRVGTYGVLTDSAGRVLLTRSGVISDVAGTWYLPGGGLHHGEHPADGVVREVAEETGLTAEITGLRGATADVLALPHRGELLHTDRLLYDLRVTGGTLRPEPDGSTDEARWVTLDEAAGLRLMPFVAEALGLPVHPVVLNPPPGEPEREERSDPTATSWQRFGAYALAEDPAGRVLLAEIAPGYPGAGRWHLPGGGTDHGERPAGAVLRELAEETGQSGRIEAVLGASGFHNPGALGPEGRPMDMHSVWVGYRVMVPNPTAPTPAEDGPDGSSGSTARSRWFTMEELDGLPVTRAVAWALDTAGHRVRPDLEPAVVP